ncbi:MULTISPECIES: hypothetical protein [Streptomyces]|jgi:aryl-alcohol dehydrogenase-like predicted oxidoreductase|nr:MULTISPECIES: hypothetical protein [Streptomyces]MCX4425815.1 hypothetical protein [Streptomyces mirabilis]MCZ1004797.1 hypothetical protein [Streptomyces mirabilis]
MRHTVIPRAVGAVRHATSVVGITPAQVALAWLIAQGRYVVAP